VEKREQIFITFNCSTTQTKMFITFFKVYTMTDEKKTPTRKKPLVDAIMEKDANAFNRNWLETKATIPALQKILSLMGG
tara:strand:- start:618 stop:854 length:237 start_codon:yes stop_codon:yes gene_type:complete